MRYDFPDIEKLRAMVRLFDANNEDFNHEYTLSQLATIYDAYAASGWDIYPDQWTENQVLDALDGWVPDWDTNSERPTKPTVRLFGVESLPRQEDESEES